MTTAQPQPQVAPQTPMPPLPLANRVGSLAEAEDPYAFYEAGWRRDSRADPAHVAGRLRARGPAPARLRLRRGTDAAPLPRRGGARPRSGAATSMHESIDWLRAKPLPAAARASKRGRARAAVRGRPLRPRLGAVGVHPPGGRRWAAWMLELHRVLADDGILIATSIGPHHSRADRQGGLGGGPHRHERASPLGLAGRPAGPWSFTRPGGCARTGAEPSRSSRSTSRRWAWRRPTPPYVVRVHEPSLARDAKARCHPHRRGSRAPGARRAARAHRRASQRPTAAGRAREPRDLTAARQQLRVDGRGAELDQVRAANLKPTPRLRL